MSDTTENQVNSPAPAAQDTGAAERVDTPLEAPLEAQPPVPATPEAAPGVVPDATAPAEPEPATTVEPDAVTQADAETTGATTGASEVPEPAVVDAGAPAAQPAPAPAPSAQPAPTPAARPARPTPAPRPGPRPGALPRPRPTGGKPSSAVPSAAEAAPVAPVHDEAATRAAAEFGRVDEDGTVWVRETAGERTVGQFPGVSTDEALALYVRRYLDLSAKVALFETRLSGTDLSVKEIDSTLAKLTEETAEPSAVGDLDGLRARVEGLGTTAAARRAELEAERAAAREAAVAERTRIIEAAERIAATDPAKMQWRPAGEELRRLLESWKEAQRSGPRIDRTNEEALWKRFSHARTTFDRERRHYFAELEQRNAAARAAKERLVELAEALSGSTDWGATAGAYRDLMAQWKAAGRASRRDDDALWARFRAAQDAFFQARDEVNAATDAEYSSNLEVKEAILVEAEALLPVRDLAAAKSALRSIQERWEDAGRVPRGDLQRVEGRLRAVENAVRDAEQTQWSRTNPETRARAEGAASQLESAIAGLESDLAKARAAGNDRKVAEIESALAARRSWLEQVVRAAEESRG